MHAVLMPTWGLVSYFLSSQAYRVFIWNGHKAMDTNTEVYSIDQLNTLSSLWDFGTHIVLWTAPIILLFQGHITDIFLSDLVQKLWLIMCSWVTVRPCRVMQCRSIKEKWVSCITSTISVNGGVQCFFSILYFNANGFSFIPSNYDGE